MIELTAKSSWRSLPSWPTPMRGRDEFLSIGEEDNINSEKD